VVGMKSTLRLGLAAALLLSLAGCDDTALLTAVKAEAAQKTPSFEKVVVHSGSGITRPSLCQGAGTSGSTFLLAWRGPMGGLWIARSTDHCKTWPAADVRNPDPDTGAAGSGGPVAIEADNEKVVACYADKADNLQMRCARSVDSGNAYSTGSMGITLASVNGRFSVALTGNVHFVADTASGLSYFLSGDVGTSWAAPSGIATSTGNSTFCQDSTFYAAWAAETGTRSLWAAESSGGSSWNTHLVDDRAPNYIRQPSIGRNGGKTYIAYRDDPGQLYFARSGDNWTSSLKVLSVRTSSANGLAVLPTDSKIFICWYDPSAQELMVAYSVDDGNTWPADKSAARVLRVDSGVRDNGFSAIMNGNDLILAYVANSGGTDELRITWVPTGTLQ
jgi:hypothetical protein